MVDLAALTDELYAVPPGDFVAARKDAVASARADGDKPTASALAALKKPTVSAWLGNLLVRTRPDDIEAALELGDRMRDATIAGDRDALRALAARRAQLLTQLVDHARALADEHGQATTAETQRELESTITAAAIDPDAAELLRSGHLVAALTFEGFGFDHGALPPPRDPNAQARRASSTKPRTPGATTPVPGRGGADTSAPTSATTKPSTPKPSTTKPPTAKPPTAKAATRTARDDAAARARAAEEAARARAAEEAEQALAVARLQQADADAELADAERVLELATRTEAEAAAAYQRAQAELADARADVRDARRDAATAARSVVTALTRLEKATRRRG
jgi:hypothetical protein